MQKYSYHRHHKPDLMLVFVLLVALAAGVTLTAQFGEVPTNPAVLGQFVQQ